MLPPQHNHFGGSGNHLREGGPEPERESPSDELRAAAHEPDAAHVRAAELVHKAAAELRIGSELPTLKEGHRLGAIRRGNVEETLTDVVERFVPTDLGERS